MKIATTLSVCLAALTATGALIGGAVQTAAVAGAHDDAKAVTAANLAFAKAQLAFGERDYRDAVRYAETAVAGRPQLADYRLLLGQSYLMAGRFGSARDAFSDVLKLDGANAKAALNLALTQIATGDFAAARATLDDHADSIGVADRGLAIALAGDPAAAVRILIEAGRAPGADAKTRQNLALSLALAGRWQDARSVASLDLAPQQVDERLGQWAAMAQPAHSYDQVAALLGVRAVADQGQPVALALSAPADHSLAAVEPAQADAVTIAAPVAPVAVAAVDAPAPAFSAAVNGVVFLPRREVVQALPVAAKPVAVAAAKPGRGSPKVALAKTAPAKPAAPKAPAKGSYYIQLGAYENAAVAKDAWGKATRRYAAFAPHAPLGTNVTANGATFYRLALGGFARPDAVALCQGWKVKGGKCFVRAGSGDQVAQWVKPAPVRLASR